MKWHEAAGWLVVLLAGIVVVAAGSHVLVSILGLKPDENQAVAAWVQAFGSIAAIGVAILVSVLQSREARSQVDRGRMRFFNAIRAIADQAFLAMGAVADKWDLYDNFTIDSRIKQKEGLADALRALSAIPLHELHSYEAVVEISKMRKTIEKAMAKLDRHAGPVFLNGNRINDFRAFERELGQSAATILHLTTALAR